MFMAFEAISIPIRLPLHRRDSLDSTDIMQVFRYLFSPPESVVEVCRFWSTFDLVRGEKFSSELFSSILTRRSSDTQ